MDSADGAPVRSPNRRVCVTDRVPRRNVTFVARVRSESWSMSKWTRAPVTRADGSMSPKLTA